MKTLTATAILTVSFLAAGGAAAQQEGSHSDAASEMQKALAVYARYAEPGSQHQLLARLVGKWNTAAKFRLSPEGQWANSMAEGHVESILGGRFFLQRVHSEPNEIMPAPYDAIAILGYDNYNEEFVMVWMDSYGTMMLTGSGSELEGDGFSIQGSYMDPISDSEKEYRWVYTFDGPDRVLLEMYESGEEGEFQTGEVVYTRKQ